MNDGPYVSVIVPVYNSIQYLKETIQSILDQTMTDFELLLVDDGSTDGSGEYCDRVCKTDRRVRVFHRENGGACAARNFALGEARGEYIAFSDNDDRYEVNLLKDNYELAKKTGADIVRYAREYRIIRDGKLVSRTVTEFEEAFYPKETFAASAEHVFQSGWGIWAGIYKRSYLERTGVLFDETMRHGYEDMDFLLRLYGGNPSVAMNPNVYYIWTMRYGHSVSSSTDRNGIDAIIKVLEEQKKLFQSIGLDTRLPYYYINRKASFIYLAFRYVSPLKVKMSFRERMRYIRYFANAQVVKEQEGRNEIRALWKHNRRNWLIYRLFYTKQYWLLYRLVVLRHHMVE